MHKLYISISIFVLTSLTHVLAQDINKYMGVITFQDSLVITYKVEFKITNNVVSGYSLTDFGGEHETKSLISGTYDDNKSLLSFKEIELVYTKSPITTKDFCNIHLQPTKFKLGSTKLFGKFKGKFNDGTECINGDIKMNSVEKINKRVTKFKKKVFKSKRVHDTLKEQLRNTKILDTLNFNILKKDEITSILTSSKHVKCTIYDGGQIDDDVVTILKDDKIILYKYKISATKKEIEIPITNKSTRITILANSEGTIGENTVVIEIDDGINKIKTMTNLKKGDKTNIDILGK